MSEAPRRDIRSFHVNGIDLTEHIKDVTFPTPANAFDTLWGFPVKEITISGTWDVASPPVTCSICGQRFVPGEEGTPMLTHASLGQPIPACSACVVPLIEQGIITT